MYEMKNWKNITKEIAKEIQRLRNSLNEKWIPCSERLPEKEGNYIVTAMYMGVTSMIYCDGWNCFRNEYGEVVRKHEIDTVIAWMPFPDAYKGE